MMKNELSVKLKMKRKKKGHTQAEVAKSLHIPLYVYGRIERGGSINLMYLVRVADYLGIKVKTAYQWYVTNHQVAKKKTMIHDMKLWDGAFQKMLSGTKTVELRLNDDKRRRIKPGDTIRFTHANGQDTLSVQVININTYDNFEDLYQHYDKVAMGYEDDDHADPKDMLAYYQKDQIDMYGVMAIDMVLLSGKSSKA